MNERDESDFSESDGGENKEGEKEREREREREYSPFALASAFFFFSRASVPLLFAARLFAAFRVISSLCYVRDTLQVLDTVE
jgi:hypothetical protein